MKYLNKNEQLNNNLAKFQALFSSEPCTLHTFSTPLGLLKIYLLSIMHVLMYILVTFWWQYEILPKINW